MTRRLGDLVPDGFDYWWYDRETGLILRNDTEYGWVAVTRKEVAEQQLDELVKALNRADRHGVADPSDVLPLE